MTAEHRRLALFPSWEGALTWLLERPEADVSGGRVEGERGFRRLTMAERGMMGPTLRRVPGEMEDAAAARAVADLARAEAWRDWRGIPSPSSAPPTSWRLWPRPALMCL